MSADSRKAPPPAASAPSLSRRRKWFFRAAVATLVPLLLFGVLESVLRLTGCGYPTAFLVKCPVPGQRTVVENYQFSRRYFPRELMRLPQPLAFQPEKPAGALRIFVFGESAAEGDPGPGFGFARILEVLLRERYRDRSVEVINTAVTAINSHVILPIGRDCAPYSGDVWVIYMGNNEVVGPFGVGTVFGPQSPSLPLIRASIASKATRTGQLLDNLLGGVGRSPAATPREWGGMEMFLRQQVRRDDPRMAVLYRHFEKNLTDLVRAGTGARARVIVSTVGSNVRDCAPFASMHRPDLTAPQLAEWEKLYQAGVGLDNERQPDAAIESYRRAASVDDEFADLHFRLGRCLAATGKPQDARRHFDLARDLDTLRFRADSRINDIIRGVAQRPWKEQVKMVDAAAVLARNSPDEIPGSELFHDHVHLTWRGNYLLAREVAAAVVQYIASRDGPMAPDGAAAFLSIEACAERLALTDRERLLMAENVWGRVKRPPFTGQLDYAATRTRWENELAELRTRAAAADATAVRELFRRALAQAEDDWRLHQNFATELLLRGDATGAAEQYRRVLQLLPHHAIVHDLLGAVLLEQGRAADAMQCYRQALALRPDDVQGFIGLSQALNRQGRSEEAMAQLRRAAALGRQPGRVRNELGLMLVQAGRKAEAMQEFLAAVLAEPDLVAARVNLGTALLGEGRSAEAITNYQEAVRLDGRNVTALLALAKALGQSGRGEEALRYHLEAVEAQPQDYRARTALAYALAGMKRLPEALEHFSAAAKLRPDSAEAQNNLGTALAALGRTAEGMTCFVTATRLKPDFAPAHLNLGAVLLEQNKAAEAVAEFRETLRLEPNNARARQLLEAATARLPVPPSP